MTNKVSVEFLQRVNDGNYEHRELKIAKTVLDDENIGQSVSQICDFVQDVLEGKFQSKTTAVRQEVTKAGVNTVTTVEARKSDIPTSVEKKVADKKVEEPKNEKATQPADQKTEAKPTDSSVKETPAKEEAPAKERTRAAETKTTQNKPKVSKNEVYNRDSDTHKNLMGSWLDGIMPKAKESDEKTFWRLPENIKKAGLASREAEATKMEFRETGVKGDILPEFKEAFIVLLKKHGLEHEALN